MISLFFICSVIIYAISVLLAPVLLWEMGRPLVEKDDLAVRLASLVSYTSLLCIVASLSLVLLFSKIKMGSIRWINWFAASSFSVYLLHEEYIVRDHYMMVLPYISRHYSGIT